VTPADLSLVFPYDGSDPHKSLMPGEPPVETRDLKLSTRTETSSATMNRGSFQANTLILRIENKSDRYVAYRVDTHTSAQPETCMAKADFPHDAIAMAPHEIIERSECLMTDKMTFSVEHVETMLLPALSYYYVSMLRPLAIGLDARTTRGHRPPARSVCDAIPDTQIKVALDKGNISWRDIIDYYARHSCERYLLPIGYHAFSKANELPLPVTAHTLPHP
jgi:hypothetical protein